MSSGSTNVRPLRPMQVLLVTADLRYSAEVEAAAELFDMRLVRLDPPGDDLEGAVRRYTPNAIIIDAEDTLARAGRLANVVAALHPRMMIVLVAAGAREQLTGNLWVVDKWRSADRLIGQLRREHLGSWGATSHGVSSGE